MALLLMAFGVGMALGFLCGYVVALLGMAW